jgi:hypothetical protein
MPNLMESAASGSTAARTMQQNMFGGQYDQQNAAAQAQEQQLKVQQEQANVEKTKLSNIVLDSGIQTTKQKTEAINKLKATAGWDQMSSEQQSEAMIKALLPIDPSDAEKMSSAAANAEYKKSLARMKQMDAGREAISNADSTIANIPDGEVDNYFKRLPPENQKAIIDKVGQDNWNSMDGKTKKAVVHDLFLGTMGKLKEAGYAMQLEKQDKIDANRVKTAQITANWHLQTRHGGLTGSKEELAAYKAYTTASAKIDAEYKTARKDIDKELSDAEAVVAKGRLGGLFGASQSKIDARDAVVAKLQKLEESNLRRDMELATLLPEGNFRTNTMLMLEKRGKILGLDNSGDGDATPTDKKPAPAPTNKPAPSREVSGKVAGVPSNKYTVENPASPTNKAEYDKLPAGSYYKQDGVIKRKKG